MIRIGARGGESMNWEAVGAIAEAVGVMAIFISLIYVAIQIRQNTEQVSLSIEANQLSAFERNLESSSHIREMLLLNPDVSKLLLDGFRSYADLETLEKLRFGLVLRNIFSSMQGAYIRHLAVGHNPEYFTGTERMLDDILQHNGVQEWLEKHNPDWRPAFQELVDLRLEAVRQ
jgi:hypothetical protein